MYQVLHWQWDSTTKIPWNWKWRRVTNLLIVKFSLELSFFPTDWSNCSCFCNNRMAIFTSIFSFFRVRFGPRHLIKLGFGGDRVIKFEDQIGFGVRNLKKTDRNSIPSMQYVSPKFHDNILCQKIHSKKLGLCIPTSTLPAEH